MQRSGNAEGSLLHINYYRGARRIRAGAIACAEVSGTIRAEESASAAHATTRATAPRESSESAPQRLPLRRVVLYKSGVGYFEHVGHVSGNEDVEIDLTSSQLNDVLKSADRAGHERRPNCGRESLYCAVIVKTVDAQTRAKTGINELLRD